MHLQGEARRDDVLWLLGSLCGLFRIPFDAALIAQDFPPPFTLGTLHEAARALGIKTGHGARPHADWQSVPLPAIAFLSPVPKSSIDGIAEPGDTDDGDKGVTETTALSPNGHAKLQRLPSLYAKRRVSDSIPENAGGQKASRKMTSHQWRNRKTLDSE